MNSPGQGAMEIYRTAAVNILIPLLFILITGITNWLSRVDERVYLLQREAVTTGQLDTTERRLVSFFDTRLADLDSKLSIVIKHLEIQQQRQEREQERK